jgi:arylsulfatase A
MKSLPVLLAALSFVLGGSGAGAAAAARPPNILFILADDMGWTDAASFGSKYYETPGIDRLVREGVKFTSAYSACTVCSPTRAALLTGRYPARLHLTDFLLGEERPYEKLREPVWQRFLPLEEETIAERLRKYGYATALIGKWHLGDRPHPTGYPANHGFDVTVGGIHGASHLPPHGPLMNLPDEPKGFLTDRLTDAAIAFMEQNRDRPFFLYLPHFAPHAPVQGKPAVIEKYRRKGAVGGKQNNPVNAALIESLDESVMRLLDTLKRLNLEENTVVIFTSDNGGEIGGANRRVMQTDCSPLRLGKGSAYEGGVRVPAVIKWPGVTRAGRVTDVPTITIDYFPTLLEIAGHAPEPTDVLDGISLVPLLRGAESLPRDELYWHFPHYHSPIDSPYSAVRSGDWKLVHFFDDDHVELYNLKDDLGETRDLAAVNPKLATELRNRLAGWRRSIGAQIPTPNPDFNPARRMESVRWTPTAPEFRKY